MKDNRLLDSKARPIMMGWEDPIMKDAANLICSNGGKILNVGFGLGIIDNYIQSYDIDEHWIIEAHPEVQNKMKEKGWDKKSNVVCLFDKWQNVYKDLPKFDGIYFDTWMEGIDPFHEIVSSLLKPEGKYAYWLPMNCNVHPVFKSKNYKVQEHVTELEYVAKNQRYYDKSSKNYIHKVVTKVA